jgi:ubiquinone/menaquinone biosynthesis C-methylase UbiE
LRLLDHPRLYELVQRAAGVQRTKELLHPYFDEIGQATVLDVGAGTGIYADLVPDEASYVAVDMNAEKLRRVTERWPERETVVADATSLPFEDRSFEHGVCIALAHHLDDRGLTRLVDELARVVTQRVLFVDPIWEPRSVRGRLLWRVDRGAYPRSADVLHTALERRFVIELSRRYSIHHHYLFCVLNPARRPG